MKLQRTANSVLTVCLSQGDNRRAKLQSFGLASRIRDVNSYLILERGRKVVEYIRSNIDEKG